MPIILRPRGAWRVGGIARRVDGSGERDGLAEFAAVDFAALVVFDQISDEAFHAGALPG